ncbi:universal stress protein [Bremerella sp. JC817]|uniref:universal stress protein n=1 Tax=Bremerella sp. JC817 TaxID=3231756 RepID=UPI0034573D2C
MLKSVLLHLSGSFGCDRVIELGARIAQCNGARLRGLSVLDTSSLQSAGQSVSAAHAISDFGRLAHAERGQAYSHEQLSEIAEKLEVPFDSIGIAGNAIESLVREAQFHDLLVTAAPAQDNRSPVDMPAWQLIDLVVKGRQPTYISRGMNTQPRRVLLPYDGTEAAARAIRSFLIHDPLQDSQCRLLGVGLAAHERSKSLQAMREYCEARRPDLEVGCLPGSVRRVLIPYASKWGADVIALGVPRTYGLWTRFLGQLSLDVLNRTHLDLFLVG